MPVPRKSLVRALLPAAFVAVLFAVAGCAPQAAMGPVAVTPLAPGQARIWFYRDYEPSSSRNYATVNVTGTPPIYIKPDGSSTYRDVTAGEHVISVESVGDTGHKSKSVDLAAGDEAYVKILSLGDWIESGDTSSFHRDTFEVSLVPPQIARAQMAAHPFAGGS